MTKEVLLYSKIQNAFHHETLEDYNKKLIRNNGNNGYYLLYQTENWDADRKKIDGIKEDIWNKFER